MAMKISNYLSLSKYRYPTMLIALIGIWFISPLSYFLGIDKYLSLFFITLLVFASLYAAESHHKFYLPIITLGAILAVLIWLRFGLNYNASIELSHAVVGLIFFTLVAFIMIQDILSNKHKVDFSLIMGAVCVYLFIAITFEFLFELIYFFDPMSFDGLTEESLKDGPFFYFSIVTLTTLGYGDITPATRIARSFVSLEAVVGQIYLTVLVARLVGMMIAVNLGKK